MFAGVDLPVTAGVLPLVVVLRKQLEHGPLRGILNQGADPAFANERISVQHAPDLRPIVVEVLLKPEAAAGCGVGRLLRDDRSSLRR